MDPKLDRTIGFPIVRRIMDGKNFRKQGGGKFVHVDDVAGAVVSIVGNENAAGQAFNLVDCYARWADLAQMAAQLLHADIEIDFSSPAEPRNTFLKDAVQSLGVPMDRGHQGLREHLERLIEVIRLSP